MRIVPRLPFSPRRNWFLPVLCAILSLVLVGMLGWLSWLSPPKDSEWGIWLGVWLFVLLMIGALALTQREKLTFREDGFERVSGLRRHFVAYDAISRVETQTRVGRGGPMEVLVVRFNARTPTLEIWPQNFAHGERAKIIAVLRQQAPHVVFDGA